MKKTTRAAAAALLLALVVGMLPMMGALTVAADEPATPTPTFLLDFTRYSLDTDTDYGLDEYPVKVTYSPTTEDGYLSFHVDGNDPWVWLRGERVGSQVAGLYQLPANQLAYMVVKYRTNFDNTEGKFLGIYFYATLEGTTWETLQKPAKGSWKNAIAADVINDGLWHTAVVDATTEKGWGTSEKKLELFRMDPLEASYGTGIIGKETDVAYIAFFATREDAEAYAAQENVAIKAELSLGAEDPALLTIGGKYYTAGKLQTVTEADKLNAFRLLDKDGQDTGLTVMTTDDGKSVAVDYLIPLTASTDADGKTTYVYEGGATYTPAPARPEKPDLPTVTFVGEDGEVIKVIPFQPGDTTLNGVPKAPAKEGYLAKWETYELGTESITVHVVYTPIATEPVTDPATEPATEPATDPATVPATDPATEPATVPATEPVTEPATDPATEPATDPATDPATTPATTPATEPATIPATSAPTATATDAASDEGCASVVGAGATALILAAMAAAVALKKRA